MTTGPALPAGPPVVASGLRSWTHHRRVQVASILAESVHDMDAPTRNCRASFPGGTERVRDLLSQKPKINNGTGGERPGEERPTRCSRCPMTRDQEPNSPTA